MTHYIVINENEIVKAEMERPDVKKFDHPFGDDYQSALKKWDKHLASLPRIQAPGHKWKLWQEVVDGKDFRWQHQMTTHKKEVWYDCIIGAYNNTVDESRRIVAIPIQPTPERDFTKFFTPDHIASFMASLLNPKDDEVILEPSAGKGSLVRAIKKTRAGVKVFAFDINEDFKPYMRNAGANVVVIKDFLSVPVMAKFSGCIANPPFGNENSIQQHFDHICNHVKVGGKIVMIVPDDFNPPIEYKTHPIGNWSKNSDGTTTEIKIIEFVNQSQPTPEGEKVEEDKKSANEILEQESLMLSIKTGNHWYKHTELTDEPVLEMVIQAMEKYSNQFR